MTEGFGLSDATDPNLWPPTAGYTYLGQFIDHDLTADVRRFEERKGAEPVNLRTPRFDLDCLYGDGPGTDDKDLFVGDQLKLEEGGVDLVRRSGEYGHIRDPRNDLNQIVLQLHLAFARFHNRVVDGLGGAGNRFKEARHIVRCHYQWIVLHDFLPQVIGTGLAAELLQGGPTQNLLGVERVGQDPEVPLEFSAAAFRFGHSMVRDAYVLNALVGGQVQTFLAGQPDGREANDLRGFRPLTSNRRIDWQLFFQWPGGPAAQLARPIDTQIAPSLFGMPSGVARSSTALGRSLPYRNFHRTELDLGLASGQEVARHMRQLCIPHIRQSLLGLEIPIDCGPVASRHDIAGTGVSKIALDASLNQAAPLWYYVLKEAQYFHRGKHLGPVGGRLVGEVLVSLMRSDPEHVINTKWAPRAGEFGCRADGVYDITDLLTFSQGWPRA